MRAHLSRRTMNILQFVFLGGGLLLIAISYFLYSGRWGGGSLKGLGVSIGFLGLSIQFLGMYFYYRTDWRQKGGKKEAPIFILSLIAVIVIPLLVTGKLSKILRALFGK